MAPEMYGKSMEIENSHPPKGGPAILPNESKEDSKPVTLPCPVAELFVNSAEIAGRMTPLPNPKMVKKTAEVQKLVENKIRTNPRADTMIPIRMTAPSPIFFIIGPTNPP